VGSAASWSWGKAKSGAALGGAILYDVGDFTANAVTGWGEVNAVPAPLDHYIWKPDSIPGALGRNFGRDLANLQGTAEMYIGGGVDTLGVFFAPETVGTSLIADIPGTAVVAHGALVTLNGIAIQTTNPVPSGGLAPSATGAFFSSTSSTPPGSSPTPSGGGSGGAPAAGTPGRSVPELGNKLDYPLGKATGSAHNIQRSTDMLRQLERIGLPDSPATRQLLNDHLTDVLNDPSNISRVQQNGRVVRESLLTGPRGSVKLETIWEGNKLITTQIYGGK
jgi:hypothetical protein